MGDKLERIAVYVTASNAIRKTADDCRRILSLYDALRIKYEKVVIDTKEMMTAISELSGTKNLPQTFVGDHFLGNYEAVFKLNETQELPKELRSKGYAGEVVGGENIPVATATPQTIKKRVVQKKRVVRKKTTAAAGGDEDDENAPPPPPDDEDEEFEEPPPPPPDEDDELPPPPPDEEDELPPPPPDEDE